MLQKLSLSTLEMHKKLGFLPFDIKKGGGGEIKKITERPPTIFYF
jgi:hypothetical protein